MSVFQLLNTIADWADGRMLAAEAAISALQSDVSAAQADIISNAARLTALESYYNENGGFMVPLINKTGSATVKGTLVGTSDSTPLAFYVNDSQYDVIGAVYDNGIADGQAARIVIHGPGQVLLKDSTAALLEAWVYASSTLGRANATLLQPPGGGFPNASEHFKEIGHGLEAVTAGTNKLAWIHLHFN